MPKISRDLSLQALAARVAAIAPPELAEPWDNCGLLVGDSEAHVRRVMTCLEVTPPTLTEARKRNADAIVAHHPLIFRPMKTLLASDPSQRLAAELYGAGIGLIAAHTNLDSASWGTNQVLAEACGLRLLGPLEPRSTTAPFKFAIFTPKGHEAKIIDAIARGGGGVIGAYTHCTFRSSGTGTFLGGAGANPFIGKAGKLEEAEEIRIEAVVPRAARSAVLREVLAVHPYEEPAYDFYVLAEETGETGLGCVAEPQRPVTAARLAGTIKRRMKLKNVRLSGPAKTLVNRIAICTGSGGSLIASAERAGAQALLTGEASYHHGVEAHARGIALIEIGHFESEQIVAAPLAARLSADAEIAAARVQVFAARTDLQPFRSI